MVLLIRIYQKCFLFFYRTIQDQVYKELPAQINFGCIFYVIVCLKEEFSCHDGTCIPDSLLCNDIEDCANGNDYCLFDILLNQLL